METINNIEMDFDTPQGGRTLPIAGRPFALVMEELAKEAQEGSGWTGRIVR